METRGTGECADGNHSAQAGALLPPHLVNMPTAKGAGSRVSNTTPSPSGMSHSGVHHHTWLMWVVILVDLKKVKSLYRPSH